MDPEGAAAPVKTDQEEVQPQRNDDLVEKEEKEELSQSKKRNDGLEAPAVPVASGFTLADRVSRRTIESEQHRHPHAEPPIGGAAGGDIADNDMAERAAEQREPPAALWPQCAAATAATMGSFLMGTAVGWSGPALALIRDNGNETLKQTLALDDTLLMNLSAIDGGSIKLTDFEASLAASLMPIGALVGGKRI